MPEKLLLWEYREVQSLRSPPPVRTSMMTQTVPLWEWRKRRD